MKKAVVYIALISFIVAGVFFVPVSAAGDSDSIILDLSDSIVDIIKDGNDATVVYDVPISSLITVYGSDKTTSSLRQLFTVFSNSLEFTQEYTTENTNILSNFFNVKPNAAAGQQVSGTVPNYNPSEFFSLLDSLVKVSFDGDDLVFEINNRIVGDYYQCVIDLYLDNDRFSSFTFTAELTGDVVSYSYYNYSAPNNTSSLSASYAFYSNVVITDTSTYYDVLYFYCYPFGYVNKSHKMIDISDIRGGSEFTLSFDWHYVLDEDGVQYPTAKYKATFYDEDFTKLDTVTISDTVWETRDHLDLNFTVPAGSKYFFLTFESGSLNVSQCSYFDYSITNLTMAVSMSAFEADSKSHEKILNRLDDLDQSIIDTNNKIDDVQNGIQDTNDKLDSIDQILKPTPEQNDKADQLEDAIGNAAGKLENNNASLEQLTPSRPQISTDLQLDQQNLLAVSPLITNIWSISGMNRMIGVVLMVATLAYVFFGKRDS